MLPSRGFFKKNDCPFFEKGLCVRPHCHFRHKKKVVSENSTSLNSQDLLVSESLADFSLINSINSESVPICSTTSDNETQHSICNIESRDQSNHNSLFAKLVNQSNPYEKISRHIPCAYTPTPQIRSVQPKNKTKSNFSSEILNKPQINNEHKSTCVKLKEIQSEPDVIKTEINLLNFKTSKVPEKVPESLSYEPQSVTKTLGSDPVKSNSDGNSISYVPSKVLTAESKYTPNLGHSNLTNNYVPSKEKPKKIQYVPEPSGTTVKNPVAYKPSDKTSGETQYQPGSSNLVTDYMPTEKIANKHASFWLNETNKNELNEFEFISSEIELMKKLLKDEKSGKKEPAVTKTELDENKEEKSKKEEDQDKEKEKDKSSKSHRSSSSRHRSGSSSHSSKSKHSSSSSSKHSSRSKSSSSHHHSSKHHSSNKSNKSSESHKRSSSSHRRSSNSSHKKSKHHSSSSSSNSSRSKEKNSHYKKEDKKEKKTLKKLTYSDEDEGSKLVEDFNSENNSSGGEGGSEIENKSGSKKRKAVWDDEQRLKLLKTTEAELFDELEDDPDTVEKQCLEIFNSYSKSEENSSKKINEMSVSTGEYENAVQGKKRTAHFTTTLSDHSVLRHKITRKSNIIGSAQEVMLKRYKTVEKAKEAQVQAPNQPLPILGLSRPSVRIAAVSNIQQMLQAKKAIQEKINLGLKVNERTTIAHTVSHGSSRVAHTPSAKEKLEKPIVTTGSKQVPCFKRQIYVDKLFLETNKIYPTKEEAIEEALKLEEEVFKSNLGSWSAYHAAYISMLMKTRRRVSAVKGETSRSNVSRPKMSHQDVLSGGKKNFSVIKTKKVDIGMLSDRHIYKELLRCKLTPEELKSNSFPMEGTRSGYATCAINFDLKYNDKYLYIKKMTGNRRYCVRCSKQYEVDPLTLKQYKEGPETCNYHPGKKKSGGKNCDRIYNCCNTSSTEGCATHVRHVTDCNDYENLPNCVKTLSKGEKYPGVFALDCEMVYTRLGYELARVTVVNLKKEVVYDTLVKPKYPIECFNTFYSGIEEKMMEGVQTTLKDVQAVLLNMFSDKTILIGHSLDSDLRALHLIHDTVVDTSVVYKNEKYHPYKYSLKDLCAKKISKIIQDNVGGHDSAEDAIAALEIMLNYVREEVGKYDSLESYEADRRNEESD